MPLNRFFLSGLLSLFFVFTAGSLTAENSKSKHLNTLADRDSIPVGYIITEATPVVGQPDAYGSVKVQFTLTLDTLNLSNISDPSQHPHYKVIIFYGDGSFEKGLVDRRDVGTSPRTTLSPDNSKIIYRFNHKYTHQPTQPILVSAARVKTGEDDPPPARSHFNIPEWIDKLPPPPPPAQRSPPPGPSTLITQPEDLTEQSKLPQELSRLVRTAAEKKFLPADLTDATPFEKNDTVFLQLDFNIGPVALNDYIGVVDLKGHVGNNIVSGSIFLHYDLADAVAEGSILLDKHKVMRWQDEAVEEYDFADFYDLEDSVEPAFGKLLKIDFTDLEPNELRRYVIPFDCLETLGESVDEHVFFYGIVLDSLMIDSVKSITRYQDDLVVETTSEVEIEEENDGSKAVGIVDLFPGRNTASPTDDDIRTHSEGGGQYLTSAPDLSDLIPTDSEEGFADLEEPISSSPSSLFTADTESGSPISNSKKYEMNKEYLEKLKNIAGAFFDDVEYWDIVRNGHDPNSITADPDTLCSSPAEVFITINVENYGSGGATIIEITFDYEGILDKNSISVHQHSFGRNAKVVPSHFVEDGRQKLLITVTNIYLPGLRELALEGDDPIDINDLSNLQSEEGSLSRGYVILKATTLDLGIARKTITLAGDVVFNDLAPIPMENTITVNPAKCGNWPPYIRFGLRLGYNYYPEFEGFEPTLDFLQNFTLGGFVDYRFRNNYRWNLRLEANLNRNSFEQFNQLLQTRNFEIVSQARYLLGRKIAVGLGPSVLLNVDWTIDPVENGLPFTFKKTQLGGILDLTYFNIYRGISAGLRGHYYPNAISFENNDIDRIGLQLYIESALFYRYFD